MMTKDGGVVVVICASANQLGPGRNGKGNTHLLAPLSAYM